MAFQYKLHKLAFEEYITAYEWYENEKIGLGEKFIISIDKHIEKICKNPQYYSLVYKSFRQAKIEGFPFMITYEFSQKLELVYISSIHHTSRSPKRKFRKKE